MKTLHRCSHYISYHTLTANKSFNIMATYNENEYSKANAPMGGYAETESIPIAAAEVITPVLVQTVTDPNPVFASAKPIAATATPAATTCNTSLVDIRNDMGREPVMVTCPHCHETGMTRVKDKLDGGSFLWGLCCCVFGFWPCALIPLCNNKVGFLMFSRLGILSVL